MSIRLYAAFVNIILAYVSHLGLFFNLWYICYETEVIIQEKLKQIVVKFFFVLSA